MGKNIIWIDDDTDIIYSVVKPLERAGHKFLRLHNVTDALEDFDRLRNADLIILDMILPPGKIDRTLGDYAGVDVLREIRANDVTTPVVAFTVVTSDIISRQLKALEVADIIRKPVRPSKLKERIDQVLAIPAIDGIMSG
jgi:CheY-like chemotaxis protein